MTGSNKLFQTRRALRKVRGCSSRPEANAPLATEKTADCLENIRGMLQQLHETAETIPLQHRILRQLVYPTMSNREEAIHDAEIGTCEWILEKEDTTSDGPKALYDSEADSEDSTSVNVCDDDEYMDFDSDFSEEDSRSGHKDENCSIPESLTKPVSLDIRPFFLGRVADPSQIRGFLYDAGDSVNSPGTSTDTIVIEGLNLQDEVDEHNDDYLIDRGHSKTQSNQRRLARDQFVCWLRSGSGIFHICGKAGSGKSTLLKYIRHSTHTKRELKIWAGNNNLVLGHFYFSNNAGLASQMSLESLHRSILFECLKECPELIKEVFPTQWEHFSTGSGDCVVESMEFTSSKIAAAFNALVKSTLRPDYKFCFFIDGLDEYHGETYDHWKLAERLRDWTAGNNLKICCSSRPHTEYLQTFMPPRTIRIDLQQLNLHDIYQFACQAFEKDQNFPLITDTYRHMSSQIAERAEGVFLWAFFAVRECSTCLGYGDSSNTLLQHLALIPTHLDRLYERLLESIAKHDRKECDKMICLTLMDPWKVFPVRAASYLWINTLDDPRFPFVDSIRYRNDELPMLEDRVKRRLDKVTRGLLEMVQANNYSKRIQFIHRTFREYVKDSLDAASFPKQFPNTSLGEVYGKLLLAERLLLPLEAFCGIRKLEAAKVVEYFLKRCTSDAMSQRLSEIRANVSNNELAMPDGLVKRIEMELGTRLYKKPFRAGHRALR
jgi:hypothetical protein